MSVRATVCVCVCEMVFWVSMENSNLVVTPLDLENAVSEMVSEIYGRMGRTWFVLIMRRILE